MYSDNKKIQKTKSLISFNLDSINAVKQNAELQTNFENPEFSFRDLNSSALQGGTSSLLARKETS